MHVGVMLLANRSFPFSLYDFHLAGVSAKELAAAYSLPVTWIEERIEAVRLCLKFQVKLSVASAPKRAAIRVPAVTSLTVTQSAPPSSFAS
jgi:hypothetical protein